jgi:nitrogen regulatory protein P-II 1
MTPRAQVNILLSDENVPATVEAILNAAYTGADGDGLIYVYPVDEVIRINTRERGHAAIMYEDDIDVRHGVTA